MADPPIDTTSYTGALTHFPAPVLRFAPRFQLLWCPDHPIISASVCLLFDIPFPLSFVRNQYSDSFGKRGSSLVQ